MKLQLKANLEPGKRFALLCGHAGCLDCTQKYTELLTWQMLELYKCNLGCIWLENLSLKLALNFRNLKAGGILIWTETHETAIDFSEERRPSVRDQTPV